MSSQAKPSQAKPSQAKRRKRKNNTVMHILIYGLRSISTIIEYGGMNIPQFHVNKINRQSQSHIVVCMYYFTPYTLPYHLRPFDKKSKITPRVTRGAQVPE